MSVPRSFGLSRMLVAECLPVCSEQCVVVEAEEVVQYELAEGRNRLAAVGGSQAYYACS